MGFKDEYGEHRRRLHKVLENELDSFAAIFDQFLLQHGDIDRLDDPLIIDKDAKIKSLECQIRSLQADLASATRATISDQSPQSNGSINGYLKQKYEELSYEHARVLRARDMLESKCRRYRESIKEWRNYYHGWVEKKDLRSTAQMNPAGSEKAVQVKNNNPEALAPPLPPSDITPTPPWNASKLPTLGDVPQLSREYGPQKLTSSEHSCKNGMGRLTKSDFQEGMCQHAPEANGTAPNDSHSDSRPTTADSSQKPTNDMRSFSVHGVSGPDNQEEELPIFVSERAVKRRRTSTRIGSAASVQMDGNVKLERAPSSPVVAVTCRPTYGAQDSLDLDDVGQFVNTPRKIQRLQRPQPFSAHGDISKLQLTNGLQGSVLQRGSDDAEDMVKNEEGEILQVQAFENSPKDHHTASSVDHEKVSEHFERERGEALRIMQQNTLKDRSLSPQASSLLNDKGPVANSSEPHSHGFGRDYGRSTGFNDRTIILGPKDPNILPRTSASKTRSAAKKGRENPAIHVPLLTEDGDFYTSSKRARHASHDSPTLDTKHKEAYNTAIRNAQISPRQRLGSLLEGSPSVKKDHMRIPFGPRLSTIVTSSKIPFKFPKEPAAQLEACDFSTASSRKFGAEIWHQASTNLKPPLYEPLENRLFSHNEPPAIDPEQEPLRVRPLQCLRLSDFKLNQNHGSYAFHESIRKHDERRKVGGCTDPFCDRCKEIARFTQLINFVAPSESRLFGSSSPLNEAAAERRLLEEYLGHDFSQRLERMSSDERREALQKAREKSFADMYGKHRQLHNRAVSPPGYWETEFPSTQQEAQNREAARAIDRVRIKERYDEALRGGMWKFADE